MKIVIPGGTGQVGMILNRALIAAGHDVVVLTRRPAREREIFGGWPSWARSDTELLLKSRRVVPGRLLDAGFEFGYPQWPDAARDLVRRFRAHALRRTSGRQDLAR